MQQPSVLSRRNPYLSKKDFGHVLVVAGSASMLGACALCSLAAMRSGAGLVTAAVAKSLNLTLQKKLSPVIMTLPLPENAFGLDFPKAYALIKKLFPKFNSIAIGPGLGLAPATKKLVYNIVEDYSGPMVIDADALNALAQNLKPLMKAKGPRILTPHEGEMARLIGRKITNKEGSRKSVALEFSKKYQCIVVLKGHQTIIASPQGQLMVNKTGNVGMATAGSGDVLTGMISAFLAQGIKPFEAASLGVFYHGQAGDEALKTRSKVSLIASDLINCISQVLK